jgi:excisionase family DNA binding protein
MQDTIPPKESKAMLFTRHEAAERLAIALRSLDEQVTAGNIPVVRIGRSVRFRPSALQFFIEANETRMRPRRRAAAAK